MELKGQRVLVTGANGFIGSHMVTRLVEEGAIVRGLVRKNVAANPHGVEYCAADVTDAKAIERVAEGCETIIHTAAQQPFAPMPARSRFQAVNVTGTENLLRAFSPRGDGRFMLLSTINVHGMPPPSGANAETPLRYSGDRYSDSKIDGERAARRMARERNVRLTVIRPSCTFGPGSTAWTLQPVQRIKLRRRVMIGNGDGTCNYIFIDNLTELIIAALKNEAAVGQAFIGSDGKVEWREFFESYARMVGLTVRSAPILPIRVLGEVSALWEEITGLPGPISRTSIAFYTHKVQFDVSKNASLLGSKPGVSFEEGMRRTQGWLRGKGLV